MKGTSAGLSTFVLLGVVACAEKDPAVLACDAVDDSPNEVTAGETLDEAKRLTVGDRPNEVTLPVAGLSEFGGYVSFEMEEPGGLLMLTDVAGVIDALFSDGGKATLGDPTPDEHCPVDLPEHWDLELEAGIWQLDLGPASVRTLRILLLDSAGHEHAES